MVGLIRELVRPYRLALACVLAAMLVQTAAALAAPWPLKIILDSVVGHHPIPVWMANAIAPLMAGGGRMQIATLAAIALVVIAIIGAVASYIENYYTESVGQWIAHDLRMRTYQHLQRLSLTFYDTHQTGSMLSTITDDVNTIQQFASASTLGIAVDLLTIVSMTGLMLWLNWDFAMIALALTPFLLLFVSRFKRSVKDATHEVRKRQSSIVSAVQQGLESMRVVQAFGQEDLEKRQLEVASKASVEAALRARRIKSSLSPVVSVAVAGCTAIVLARGAALILRDAMTVGELTVFLAYLTRFFKPVQDLAKMSNTLAQAAVGVDRVQALLETDMTTPERADAVDPPPVTDGITFEGVAFHYRPDQPVLKDVSFKAKACQMVGIVGPTGSGKSTVMSLIPRFYEPTAGTIRIDGVNVADMKLQPFRDQIGYVLQDTVLFRGTVADNIAFGRPGATREQVTEAAKAANAHEFIQQMTSGYDTMVGEGAQALSGGQRQRIGIARVMIRNSPILLLDEPTAALDSESERTVIEALERLMEKRTVIMIAHRLTTIRDANLIVVLKDGMVAEQGSHDELMARNGVYAELHRTQFTDASIRDQQPQAAASAAVIPAATTGD
ncbi:MAG TPA: ABC transporter ATP-binding protein [Candidatus Acidoferrales bacterium]|nr:ABC transporter ATP-binding protein [Candidatus Acidoferrales bacterium]